MAEIKHIDAFEYYYSLGSARSYEKVAQAFSKSRKTVEKWGYTEKWQEEVKLRDIAQVKENRRISLLSRRAKFSDYKKIIDASIQTYVEELKKGKIKVNSVKDIEALIKLQCYLDDFVVDGEEKVIDTSPLGLGCQSACATELTSDTPETKQVLQQIEESLRKLGDSDD